MLIILLQASLETFFGLGLIVGPTVGGALYQVSYYSHTVDLTFTAAIIVLL